MLRNVKYVDFKKAGEQHPELKRHCKDIHSINIDGTIYINTAFKGGEVKRVLYNLKTNEVKKI
jgi:hypothetical protein